ncbi:hypothetical protein BJ508DRAFT_114939 [Ascobolus immersus RN42]|uniref:Uncharacterized protein n=1 Tax=Ascobolus immersus RN42 TaxID=1160509 RepID=A0A3N4I950_ASCIM|nr:hypothetical protein BJ508DRAFT_114939 [Ascobolus immersus RN42]
MSFQQQEFERPGAPVRQQSALQRQMAEFDRRRLSPDPSATPTTPSRTHLPSPSAMAPHIQRALHTPHHLQTVTDTTLPHHAETLTPHQTTMPSTARTSTLPAATVATRRRSGLATSSHRLAFTVRPPTASTMPTT